MTLSRRTLLQAAGAAAVASPFTSHAQSGQSIVVIGGGFGGATAARYLKRFNPALRITLIEPNAEFVMCPMSNRVIHGGMTLKDISRPYDRFVSRNDLRWIRAAADEIDPEKREVRAGKDKIAYDRLIVAPGVDYNYDGIAGMGSAQAQALIPHACGGTWCRRIVARAVHHRRPVRHVLGHQHHERHTGLRPCARGVLPAPGFQPVSAMKSRGRRSGNCSTRSTTVKWWPKMSRT